MSANALGLIETRGLVGLTEAADAAVKAAAVEICGVERIEGGLVSIHLSGDVGAVTAAVEAGARAAQRVGHLVARHIIPRPHEALAERFGFGSWQSGSNPGHADLEACSVAELRRLARQTPGLPIQGREISRANRERLIGLLRAAGVGPHPTARGVDAPARRQPT